MSANEALAAALRPLVAELVREELARREPDAGGTPKHVTVVEYATARSISASTVRAAIREGRLPTLRVGRAVRIRADVEIATRSDVRSRAARRLGLIAGGRP